MPEPEVLALIPPGVQSSVARGVFARASRLRKALQDADLAGYRRVASHRSSRFDAVLPRLSHAANGGRIWLVIAGGLLFSNDKRARAAALRGVAALTATSVIVNGPIKFFFRRRRPEFSIVPAVRLLRRMPKTWSFPSGHSATSAAFATAVGREYPAAGVVVGLLAGAVGYSRVYTGAHYPGDVVAGAALGTLIGLNACRLTPLPTANVTPKPSVEKGTALPGGSGLAIAVNTESGGMLSPDPSDALRKVLPDSKLISGGDMGEVIRTAAEAGASALGVAGGDGTVRSAAECALEYDKPLAVFPAGTLNHFARDCALSSVDDVAKAVDEGTVTRVDVGWMADKLFLNTATFGTYAQMVDLRESMEHRLGKWLAASVALTRVLARSKPSRVLLNGKPRSVWSVFIGNGRYEPRGFAPLARERLDEGTLDVRVLRAERPWSRTRAVIAALAGRLERSPVYEAHMVSRFEIESLDGPLRLACDGETFDGPRKVAVRKDRRALSVYVPEHDASD